MINPEAIKSQAFEAVKLLAIAAIRETRLHDGHSPTDPIPLAAVYNIMSRIMTMQAMLIGAHRPTLIDSLIEGCRERERITGSPVYLEE